MGLRNYLVDGVSGTGKTSVAEELERRGYAVVHGDRTLAYQGDPVTGAPIGGRLSDAAAHRLWIWPVDTVRSLVADQHDAVTFFCGGARNYASFVDLFDGVFVLDVDTDTLNRRLDRRPADEFGRSPEQRAIVLRLHATREDVPDGMIIDATVPLQDVVDAILRHCELP